MSRWRLAVPIALALLFATLCVTSLVTKSGTWDEYRVGIGARRDFDAGSFHPPLSSVLHSLPFHWLEIPEEIWSEPWGPRRGQRIVALRDDDLMLDAARIALLPVALGALALVWRWGRRLYGTGGAAIAAAAFALDPNVIAHARLITPDMTLAATTLLALFALARVGETPTTARRIALGGALALVFLSKFTALLLVPILLATHLGVAWRCAADDRGAAVRRACGDAAAGLAVAAAIVWAAYGFSVGPVTLGTWTLTLPAPAYASGAAYQWAQSQQPHAFFLLGDRSSDGWWYFYAVVLAGKVPLVLLFLLGLGVGVGTPRDAAARRDELYLWIPGVVLLGYLSFFNTIHNGFRYLLPVWLPLFVLLGRLGPWLAGPRLRQALVVVPMAALAATTLHAWPDYLAYCNALVGGPGQGYRVFSDSNLDWGQDLEALKRWMDAAGVDRVQLAYFGTADPAHWGIDYVPLPSPVSALPPLPAPPEGTPAPRWVALSAYQYQGVAFGEQNPYARFHAFRPNARAGHSILLFDLENLQPR